jgi:uncharacterized damage-inducible protein DinB
MTVALTLEDLLAYSDHERAKWRQWFGADPSRLTIVFQPGGRFPTVASVLDHLFLVERRHLSRLQGGSVPDHTGVDLTSVDALFEYADRVRADYRAYATTLPDATEPIVLNINVGTFEVPRRKLALQILLHEIRHFAQVAYAARVAGHEPPALLDYLFSPEPV